MANLTIVPRNFHDEATLSVQSESAEGFGIANTQNTQRSRVWRSTSGADQYFAGTFDDGLARTCSYFGMFRHRAHGGKIRVQLYSAESLGGSVVYDSTAVDAINIVPTDGLDWGIDPYGDGPLDPYILDAPFWLYFDPVECLSYKATFSDNVATYGAEYWQVCRFWLGNYFTTTYNPIYGSTLQFANGPDGWRRADLNLACVPESERAAWLDVQRRCGIGSDRNRTRGGSLRTNAGFDLVAALFRGENSRRERDHHIDAKLEAVDELGRYAGYLSHHLRLEEV